MLNNISVSITYVHSSLWEIYSMAFCGSASVRTVNQIYATIKIMLYINIFCLSGFSVSICQVTLSNQIVNDTDIFFT